MKRISIIIILSFLSICGFSQNYTVTPYPYLHIDTTDVQKDYYFNIVNNTNSKLALSWELLENTIPTSIGWTFNVCDYQACILHYTLPNQRDMDSIPANMSSGAYLKLGINTYAIAGHGILKFFLYETGTPTVGDTLIFDITATGVIGISENIDENSISLSPNPASNFVNLKLDIPANENTEITIFNAVGDKMKMIKRELNQSHLKIDVTDYPSGIYYVSVSYNGGKVTKKFIVQ